MSDASTRKLERGVAVTPGDVEGRTRWLAARLRAGNLTEQNLSLAAWVGDVAAQSLLPLYTESDHLPGVCPCGECLRQQGLVAWLRALSSFGSPIQVRALWAVASAARDHLAQQTPPDDAGSHTEVVRNVLVRDVDRVLGPVTRWLDAPDDQALKNECLNLSFLFVRSAAVLPPLWAAAVALIVVHPPRAHDLIPRIVAGLQSCGFDPTAIYDIVEREVATWALR